MAKFDRNSLEDSRKVFNAFFSNETEKIQIINFLANAIIYSNGLNNQNWNVNLDPNGRFVRFNVGHEYCVEISSEHVLILVLRDTLALRLKGTAHDIEFQGHNRKSKVFSRDIESTPDCLSKVPGSIACHVKNDDFANILPIMEAPNREFIAYAISNTVQLPAMNKAHSPGVIDYLSRHINVEMNNPVYSYLSETLLETEAKIEKQAFTLSDSELLEKISSTVTKRKPEKVEITSTQFKRNPYISAYTKKMANGFCFDCKQPAPFICKETGQPFLEVHHLEPLSNGGPDSIENTIALCPNCHRKRHYG